MRVTRGAIFDVIVDLRADSATFCGWFGVELDAASRARRSTSRSASPTASRRSSTTPRSSTRSATRYVPDAARGVRFDDPALRDRRGRAPPRGRAPDLRARPRVPRLRAPDGPGRAAHRRARASSAATRSPRCSSAASRSHAVSRGAVSGDGASGVRWHRADLTDAVAARELLRARAPDAPAAPRLVRRARRVLDLAGERALAGGEPGAARRLRGRARRLRRHLRRIRLERRRARSTSCGSPIRPATPYGVAKDALRREAPELLARARDHRSRGGGSSSCTAPASTPTGSCRRSPARCSPASRRAAPTGRQVRDFLHSGDAGRAFAALLDADVEGPVNIASGVGVPVAELVGWIGEALGRPELIELGALPTRPGEPDATRRARRAAARRGRLHARPSSPARRSSRRSLVGSSGSCACVAPSRRVTRR